MSFSLLENSRSGSSDTLEQKKLFAIVVPILKTQIVNYEEQLYRFQISEKYTVTKIFKVGRNNEIIALAENHESNPPNFVWIKKIEDVFSEEKLTVAFTGSSTNTTEQFSSRFIYSRSKHALREVAISAHFGSVSCQNIQRLVDLIPPVSYLEFKDLYMVFETHPMNLKDFLLKRYNFLDIMVIKKIFFQMVVGLHFMHSAGLVHLDLRPENWLIDPSTLAVKLSHFANSREILPFEYFSTSLDVPAYYRAIEMWKNPDDLDKMSNDSFKIDIWALGCILFELLQAHKYIASGQLLFKPTSEEKTASELKAAILDFVSTEKNAPSSRPTHARLAHYSTKKETLVMYRMLKRNPSERPSCIDIIKDPWLSDELKKYKGPIFPLQSSNSPVKFPSFDEDCFQSTETIKAQLYQGIQDYLSQKQLR